MYIFPIRSSIEKIRLDRKDNFISEQKSHLKLIPARKWELRWKL